MKSIRNVYPEFNFARQAALVAAILTACTDISDNVSTSEGSASEESCPGPFVEGPVAIYLRTELHRYHFTGSSKVTASVLVRPQADPVLAWTREAPGLFYTGLLTEQDAALDALFGAEIFLEEVAYPTILDYTTGEPFDLGCFGSSSSFRSGTELADLSGAGVSIPDLREAPFAFPLPSAGYEPIEPDLSYLLEVDGGLQDFRWMSSSPRATRPPGVATFLAFKLDYSPNYRDQNIAVVRGDDSAQIGEAGGRVWDHVGFGDYAAVWVAHLEYQKIWESEDAAVWEYALTIDYGYAKVMGTP